MMVLSTNIRFNDIRQDFYLFDEDYLTKKSLKIVKNSIFTYSIIVIRQPQILEFNWAGRLRLRLYTSLKNLIG